MRVDRSTLPRTPCLLVANDITDAVQESLTRFALSSMEREAIRHLRDGF
jgi:hypothetical protein